MERCAELVAIEARVSEIDAHLRGAGLRRRQRAICTCGAPLLIGARFCPSCGRPLESRSKRRRGHRGVSDERSSCPRCGAPLAVGQEYCLECGLRQPGRARLGPLPTETRALRLRIAGLAAIAVAGAAVAIAVASDGTSAERVLTATGGSVTVRTPEVQPQTRLAVWPRSRSGWTIVLVSIPKARGPGRGGRGGAAGPVTRSAPCRRARLLPVREPPARLLDDVCGPLPERGGRDRLAQACAGGREGRARPAHPALTSTGAVVSKDNDSDRACNTSAGPGRLAHG